MTPCLSYVLVPEACRNDCCSYSCRDMQRILIPEPGMLVVKKTGVYCDLRYPNVLKTSGLTCKTQDLQETYSLGK